MALQTLLGIVRTIESSHSSHIESKESERRTGRGVGQLKALARLVVISSRQVASLLTRPCL
jgi:hypothetical protein